MKTGRVRRTGGVYFVGAFEITSHFLGKRPQVGELVEYDTYETYATNVSYVGWRRARALTYGLHSAGLKASMKMRSDGWVANGTGFTIRLNSDGFCYNDTVTQSITDCVEYALSCSDVRDHTAYKVVEPAINAGFTVSWSDSHWHFENGHKCITIHEGDVYDESVNDIIEHLTENKETVDSWPDHLTETSFELGGSTWFITPNKERGVITVHNRKKDPYDDKVVRVMKEFTRYDECYAFVGSILDEGETNS